MQTNKLLRSLLVAVPAVTLMACGSTQSVNEQAAAETNTVVTDSSSGVQLSPATEVLTPQEQILKQIKASGSAMTGQTAQLFRVQIHHIKFGIAIFR